MKLTFNLILRYLWIKWKEEKNQCKFRLYPIIITNKKKLSHDSHFSVSNFSLLLYNQSILFLIVNFLCVIRWSICSTLHGIEILTTRLECTTLLVNSVIGVRFASSFCMVLTIPKEAPIGSSGNTYQIPAY